MRSSYIGNNYGEVFESLITKTRPEIAVELGVLDGYSSIHIAMGLWRNGRGRLIAFDLFDEYPYKHGDKAKVMAELNSRGLGHLVQLREGDGELVYEQFGNHSIDFLHVDISNTGEVLKKIMEVWDPKIALNGVIVFEGGSMGRELVEWMVKYNKPSIRKELFSNQIIKDHYCFEIMEPYPSLTILTKIKG